MTTIRDYKVEETRKQQELEERIRLRDEQAALDEQVAQLEDEKLLPANQFVEGLQDIAKEHKQPKRIKWKCMKPLILNPYSARNYNQAVKDFNHGVELADTKKGKIVDALKSYTSLAIGTILGIGGTSLYLFSSIYPEGWALYIPVELIAVYQLGDGILNGVQSEKDGLLPITHADPNYLDSTYQYEWMTISNHASELLDKLAIAESVVELSVSRARRLAPKLTQIKTTLEDSIDCCKQYDGLLTQYQEARDAIES